MRDPLSELPGYRLRRASAAMLGDLARRLEPVALTPVEASVILLIGSNQGLTQSAIGRALGIQRANMAPLIARLEARGQLTRKPADGRSHTLSLTPAGHSVHDAVAQITAEHEAQLLNRIAPEDRPGFLRALDSLWR